MGVEKNFYFSPPEIAGGPVRATETVEKFNYKSYNEFHSLLINHGKTSVCHDAATESLIINFLPANSQITTILAKLHNNQNSNIGKIAVGILRQLSNRIFVTCVVEYGPYIWNYDIARSFCLEK